MQVESEEREVDPVGEQQPNEHKTLNHHSLYYTFLERYFSTHEGQHQYLHRHSNGLFMIQVRVETLPSPAVQIRDVLEVQEVRGKKKRGGLRVGRDALVVEIVCKNGEVVPILAHVEGVVLEKNARLTVENMGNPEGYVIVINPPKRYKPDPEVFRELPMPHLRK